MRLDFALSGILALGLADAAAAAQRPRIYSTPAPEPPPAIARALRLGGDDEPRAVLGISTNGSGSARDTLGVLVSSVVPNSPADKAGIEEGNRIASINGVSLSL